MKTLLYAGFLIAITLTGNAQNVSWDKKNFDDKKAYKKAFDEYEKGLELFNQGEFQYKNALRHFNNAYEFNPDNALLNYYIGKCIIETVHKSESVNYFDAAYKLDEKVADDIYFQLASSHHINADWDLAQKYYILYKEQLVKTVKKKNHLYDLELKLTDKHIQECLYGKEAVKNPVRVFIDNVGEPINTEYAEYGASITADNSTMFFTARKPGVTGSKPVTEKDIKKNHQEQFFYEDVYVTHKLGNKWSEPQNLGDPINTNGQEATVSISPDGQSILFYSATSEDGGLYESELNGDEWIHPHKLDRHINSKYHEESAVYSLDKKRIFFVTNNPENNYGGEDFLNRSPDLTHDIFYCDYDEEKKKWSKPINMGSHINTEYNERGVFLHNDGKTLFFSSEGHSSIGGYDLFKTVYDEETNIWSKPVNLGYPLNTPGDDIYFVLTADGRTGYYASEHEDGLGKQDIYQITFLGQEKKPIASVDEQLLIGAKTTFTEEISTDKLELVAAQSSILKGRTLDEKTKEPVGANIELIDNTKNKIIATFHSNSKTGKFLVSLPAGKNYGIAVTAESYLFHSENFDIPKNASFNEFNKDVYLKKVETGMSIVLKNIFFDFNKASLRPESTTELNRLTELLKDNPSLEIEIGGHTDDKGTDSYNQQLSEKRANAVVNFLVKNGIEEKRLTFKGYGESSPIATNETDEGRQENRRTEFKIIKQ